MLQNGKFLANFLAFDTSTDVMSVALTDGTQIWQHTGPGGAHASSTLIPVILALLAEAGLLLGNLNAIAFGRGPGSFTGLRTACAVAQGLAYGSSGTHGGDAVDVLPIDTLMALAEEARQTLWSSQQTDMPPPAAYITALLDARMDEMYVQRFAWHESVLTPLGAAELTRPEDLQIDTDTVYAGNVFDVYDGRLPAGLNSQACLRALPTAAAMLRLAPQLAASGHCVPADRALPLYVRDKVAQTTLEREAAKSIKLLAARAV